MDPAKEQAIRDSYEYLRAIVAEEDPGWPERVDEDFEWVDAPDFPGASSYRGREEIGRFFRTWTHYWDKFRVEPEEFVHLDSGQVLVSVVLHYEGKGIGVPMEQRYVHLYDFREGRASRVRIFSNREQARAEAGSEAGGEGAP
jgi:ketosteroid isomerase-like protein